MLHVALVRCMLHVALVCCMLHVPSDLRRHTVACAVQIVVPRVGIERAVRVVERRLACAAANAQRCNMQKQHAPCNRQPCQMKECNLHAACNKIRTTCKREAAKCNVQHATTYINMTTCSIQRVTYNTQHTTYSMQRAPCSCTAAHCQETRLLSPAACLPVSPTQARTQPHTRARTHSRMQTLTNTAGCASTQALAPCAHVAFHRSCTAATSRPDCSRRIFQFW